MDNKWLAVLIVSLAGFLSNLIFLIKLRELIRDELRLFFEEG